MTTQKFLKILFFILVALLNSGCGSVILTFLKPPDDGKLVYVGARGRLDQITLNVDTDNHGTAALILAWPIIVADFFLCIGADTIFLPYTIPVSLNAQDKTDQE